jgi:hypothetical protein
MDVRFCEGRNHGRQAHMRAAGSGMNVLARSSTSAREENCVFLLTSTFMDVGHPELELGVLLSRFLKRKRASECQPEKGASEKKVESIQLSLVPMPN